MMNQSSMMAGMGYQSGSGYGMNGGGGYGGGMGGGMYGGGMGGGMYGGGWAAACTRPLFTAPAQGEAARG